MFQTKSSENGVARLGEYRGLPKAAGRRGSVQVRSHASVLSFYNKYKSVIIVANSGGGNFLQLLRFQLIGEQLFEQLFTGVNCKTGEPHLIGVN